MKDYPFFSNFYQHWCALRTDSNVPNRAEIDPRIFSDVLENVLIAERINDDDFRIRLAGMDLCQMMGMEVRGQPFASLMQDDQREKMQLILGQLLDRPAIAEINLNVIDVNGAATALDFLLLPLRSDLGDVSRLIGCISKPRRPIVGPVKFQIKAQRLLPLSTIGSGAELREMAEPQASFGTDGPKAIFSNPDMNVNSAPKRGHLRLVSSRDQET